MTKTKCAFCKGTGKDPFELLSELANCQVCGATGEVTVEAPYVECVYCGGSGVQPQTRNTCIACRGKGVVPYRSSGKKCSACKGTGRNIGKGDLPCLECKGTGLVGKES